MAKERQMLTKGYYKRESERKENILKKVDVVFGKIAKWGTENMTDEQKISFAECLGFDLIDSRPDEPAQAEEEQIDLPLEPVE